MRLHFFRTKEVAYSSAKKLYNQQNSSKLVCEPHLITTKINWNKSRCRPTIHITDLLCLLDLLTFVYWGLVRHCVCSLQLLCELDFIWYKPKWKMRHDMLEESSALDNAEKRHIQNTLHLQWRFLRWNEQNDDAKTFL